jgi:hypothetical protein
MFDEIQQCRIVASLQYSIPDGGWGDGGGGGEIIWSLHRSVPNRSRAHHLSHPAAGGKPSRRVKRSGREAGHSPQTSA